MALDTHYKVAFADAVKELAGSPQRALLPALCSPMAKAGEAVFVDAYGLPDAADELTIAQINTRAEFESIVGPDTADVVNLWTPHKEYTRQRTYLAPKRIETGHTVDSIEKVLEMGDPTSKALRSLMTSIWLKEDSQVLAALRAATVSRGKDAANLASVSFPAGQQLTVSPAVGATAGTWGVFSLETIDQIVALFEMQYRGDGNIRLVMSPSTKQRWLSSQRTTLQSRDFVDSARYFQTGELPTISGVSVVAHPLCADTEFFAWHVDGVARNTFGPLTTKMDENPGHRFNVEIYLHEEVNVVRSDDNLVVQGTIEQAGS